ncbi:MAG: response regulator [Pirellulales bacterium]|nr:response regulator [Pirellulales bacterium]
MRRTAFYRQECPTCGRSAEINVEYLGRGVTCQHCRSHFIATDPDTIRLRQGEESALLQRAEALLREASARIGLAG